MHAGRQDTWVRRNDAGVGRRQAEVSRMGVKTGQNYLRRFMQAVLTLAVRA